MNNREAFLWAIAIVSIAAVLLSPVACTMHQNSIVEASIKGAADPIAVRCAMESPGTNQSPVCLIKAAQGVKAPEQPKN